MSDSEIERLTRLRQRRSETWQGGWVRVPSWISKQGERPYRPWMPLWVSLQSGKVHGGTPCRPEEKDLAQALAALVEFACDDKLAGCRPGKLEVNDSALADELSERLAELDLRITHRPKLLGVDRYLQAMAESLADGPVVPGALDVPGVTVERMRSFAEAAAAFSAAEPWEHLTDEDLIRIEAPPPGEGLGCATVLGSGGLAYGLLFFRSAEEYWRMFERAADPQRQPAQPPPDTWSVSLDDLTELPLGDADLWEDHDLPTAGERGYPFACCLTARRRIRRPSPQVLAFVEGLLRALAASTEDEIDSGRWTREVHSFDGPVAFTLALPELLSPTERGGLMRHGVMPDRRAMERASAQMQRYVDEHPTEDADELNAIMRQKFIGKTPDQSAVPPRTPLEEAQDLCYQAFEARGRRRIQMARKAIEICPDCADAYVILAERKGDAKKARQLYAQGVAAGERALGTDRLEEDAGHFWGMVETRPYMRARLGLAEAMERLGQVKEAVEHYRALLRLNPGDNQGARYPLVARLLQLGRDDEAAEVLDQYEDDITAAWRYCRALVAFRRQPGEPAAGKLLREAIQANPHVPKYLLGAEEMPPALPGHYALGDEAEAKICAAEVMPAWDETPGARDWLEAQWKQARPRK